MATSKTRKQQTKKHLSDIYEVNESSSEQWSEYQGRYSNVIHDLSHRQNYIRPRVDVNHKKQNNMPEIDSMKIVMLGDSGSGKTSLMLRFTDNMFVKDTNCTVGVDIKIKQVKIDGYALKLQVWDTAGQEKFQSVQQNYYRGSHGCIAVYDITNRKSFDQLKESLAEYMDQTDMSENEIDSDKNIEKAASGTINNNSVQLKKTIARLSVDQNEEYQPPNNIILVGMKLDISKGSERKVSYREGLNFAKKLNVGGFIETSAKQSQMIEDVNDIFRILSILHFESKEDCLPVQNQALSATAKMAPPLSIKKKASLFRHKAMDESSIYQSSSSSDPYKTSIASSDLIKMKKLWAQRNKEDEQNNSKCC